MTDLVEALRLEGDRRVSEKEMTFGNSKSKEDRIADDLCYQAASRISQQDAELERLKAVIAWANNSLFGSHGFFLSLTLGDHDEHHLDRAIEDLKERNRKLHAELAAERESVADLAAETTRLTDTMIASRLEASEAREQLAEAEKKFETADKLRVFWNDKATELAAKLSSCRRAAFLRAKAEETGR